MGAFSLKWVRDHFWDCETVYQKGRCMDASIAEKAYWKENMAGEVVVDALPYYDQGYDDPGVREAVSGWCFEIWSNGINLVYVM